MTRVYIAGPMTGLPDFNYPAFHAAAAELRARGLEVLNPAENIGSADNTWNYWMRLALAQLIQCDEIVLLPGWAASRGAQLERQIAEALEMPITELPAPCPWCSEAAR